MKIESLEQLEAEVNRAVELIDLLRREKTEITESLEESQKEVERLKLDNERLNRIYQENVHIIERKEEIVAKIEGMLSKLDSIQT